MFFDSFVTCKPPWIMGGCSCEAPAAMQFVTQAIAIRGTKRHLLVSQTKTERWILWRRSYSPLPNLTCNMLPVLQKLENRKLTGVHTNGKVRKDYIFCAACLNLYLTTE